MIRDGSYVKIGGSKSRRNMKKSLYKILSKKNRTMKKQRGGCGCDKSQTGGRVMKPSEFYGGNSGRYFSEGSSKLVPEDHAYGKTHAVSFGSLSNDMKSTGPNLGPYPNSSGMMTGGRSSCNKRNTRNTRNTCNTGKKSNKRNNKRRSRSRSRKSKK